MCRLAPELNDWSYTEELFSKKGSSVKGHLCSTKMHLDNPDGYAKVEPPFVWKLFLISFIYIKKKGTFSEVSDPRTLYLSKIGLVSVTITIPSKSLGTVCL